MFHDWTDHDRRAFEEVEHANGLAESLSADGGAGQRSHRPGYTGRPPLSDTAKYNLRR